MFKITYVYTIPEDQPIEFFTPSDESIEYAVENYGSHIVANEKKFSDDFRTLTQILVFDEKDNFLRYSSDTFLNQNNFLPKKFYNEQRGITMSVIFENLEATF